MSDRDAKGRFTLGNRIGVTQRLKLGRSGNPRGRPPSVLVCRARFRAAGLGLNALREVFADPHQPHNARRAARNLLIPHVTQRPIPDHDPQHARRLCNRSVNRSTTDLLAILLDSSEDADQPEGARLRLEPWP